MIQTQRLILKPISFEYTKEIFQEFTKEITKYMTPEVPKDIDDTIEFISGAIDSNKKKTDLFLMVFNKEKNEYLGNAGIHNINKKTPSLGIWIKKTAHGNAYGKEAIFALKDWCDKTLDYEYILYTVVKENYASKRIVEALGGVKGREYVFEKENGIELDVLEYRIYKK